MENLMKSQITSQINRFSGHTHRRHSTITNLVHLWKIKKYPQLLESNNKSFYLYYPNHKIQTRLKDQSGGGQSEIQQTPLYIDN